MESRILPAGSPTLTVVLNASSMSEFAAGNGVSGSVRRSDASLTEALTVNLHSSDTSEASVPATVTIPAGATSVSFNILPVDDNLLDGTQSLQITASAPGFTYSSTTAGPAGLEPTFGAGGYAPARLAWGLSSAYPDVVIQPDGAIVSFSQTAGSGVSWTLTRHTPTGAADLSFGGSGFVTTTFSSVTQVAPTSMVLQPDGRILAVGHVSGGVTIWDDMVVVRYNSNGTLDTSFGSGGIVSASNAPHTRQSAMWHC